MSDGFEEQSALVEAEYGAGLENGKWEWKVRSVECAPMITRVQMDVPFDSQVLLFSQRQKRVDENSEASDDDSATDTDSETEESYDVISILDVSHLNVRYLFTVISSL